MTTDRDPRTRIVLSWLRDETHENAERVLLRALDEVDTTPQRRAWWPARRTSRMKAFANLVAAAAAVLVVAIVGYQFLPGGSGPGATTATPSPSPVLLARGNFFIRDWDRVEFEASREGSSVTGRMAVGLDAERRLGQEHAADFLSVDLRCARTTNDGLILIGGYTDAAGGRFDGIPQSTLGGIALKPGSPTKAQIWVGPLSNEPAMQTTDCVAYLDASLAWSRTTLPGENWLRDDIRGTVDFGQPEAAPSVEPSPAAGLPVGAHVMVSRVGLNEDRVTVAIPAAGWSAEPDEGSLTKDPGGADRVTVVTVPGDHYRVPRDICNWQTGSDRDPGYRFASTVDELVTYLTEQTSDTPEGSVRRDLSTPVGINIDGHPGLSITGAVPGSEPSGCDGQRFCSLMDRDGGQCLLPHLEPNALVTLWISAPPGRNPRFWIVAASYWPTTGSDLRAEVNAIVDSMTIPTD